MQNDRNPTILLGIGTPGEEVAEIKSSNVRTRLGKSERQRQILLELKLRPHVRIGELANRFGVSNESVRRDFRTLSRKGLINRAHGGASAPAQGHYPSLDERASDRVEPRARIGRMAAALVQDGETVIIDSGSTTIELARSLAFFGTKCTVITNSLPIAMILGHADAEVILCPGQYIPAESAVVGTETVEFLNRLHVDRAMIGASGLTSEGPSETVRGFAAIKRAAMQRSEKVNLLIDSEKFGLKGLALVGTIDRLQSVVVDRKPQGDLLSALDGSQVDILVAD